MLNFTLGPPTKRAGLAICTGERGFLIECTTASLCERGCGYAAKRSIQTGAHVITFRPAGEEKREQSALRPPVCQILLASGRRAVKRTTRSSQLADGTRLKRAACMNLLRPFRAGARQSSTRRTRSLPGVCSPPTPESHHKSRRCDSRRRNPRQSAPPRHR